MFKYKPSRYVLNRIKDFSEQRMVLSSNLYKWRGEKNTNKMKNDIIVGTLGEYAIYNFLKDKGLPCSRPDLKIYEKRKKSFGADLKSEEINIHVKSQSSESVLKYGQSYLFQKSDKLFKEPKGTEWLAFVTVDLNALEASVVGFVKAKDIKDNELWGECRVPMYRHSKAALYLEELEPFGIIKKEIKNG